MTTEILCKSRPSSTWTRACRCPECVANFNHIRKLVRCGRYSRVPASAGLAALDEMLAKRWSYIAIASATGITESNSSDLVLHRKAGREIKLGARTAAMLVGHGEPTRGSVGAIPTMRKLRALSRIGYTLQMMADHSGQHLSTLASIREDRSRGLVRVYIATAVDQMYKKLSGTPGGSQVAATTAAKKDWPGPLHWDDIDNLDEAPRDDADPSEDTEDFDEAATLAGQPTAAIYRRMYGERVPISKTEQIQLVHRCIRDGWEFLQIERITGLNPDRILKEEAAATTPVDKAVNNSEAA